LTSNQNRQSSTGAGLPRSRAGASYPPVVAPPVLPNSWLAAWSPFPVAERFRLFLTSSSLFLCYIDDVVITVVLRFLAPQQPWLAALLLLHIWRYSGAPRLISFHVYFYAASIWLSVVSLFSARLQAVLSSCALKTLWLKPAAAAI